MSYKDTIDYLYGLQKHGIKLGLKNTLELLSKFGNPQRDYKSVHVAGTNGKGSTAAMLASMLKQGGLKVGLFTSPHLVSFTERISINGVKITEEEVVELAASIREKASGINPTFFEVVTIMGFLYFRKKGVQWAVVETGLGGRLDATNVLEPEVSMITTLGMDHMEFLGDSLDDIAFEKAGIIKRNTPVVTASRMDAIEKTARELGSDLYTYGEDFSSTVKSSGLDGVLFDYVSTERSIHDLTIPLPGDYQALNASLAIKTLDIIRGTAENIKDSIRDGLSSLKWPGRLELVSHDPLVFIDGAHNPGAAAALAKTLRTGYLKNKEKFVLVMGVMGDKDIGEILKPLLPLAGEIIFTAPSYGRASNPRVLVEYSSRMGHGSKTAGSVKEALDMARAASGGRPILVTGSFYTIGEALIALGKKGILTRLRET
jgi:dihydrofolate synthase/folylpolyglutamate synthase